MKKRLYRTKVVLLMLSVISVMGMTACSFEPKEKTAPEAAIEPKTTEEKTLETENKKAETEAKKAETETTKAKTEDGTMETEIAAKAENGKEDSAVEE